METHTILAICEERVVGLIRCDKHYIDLLFVEPNNTRKGIAKRLYQYVESQAKAQKFEKLEVDASLTAKQFFIQMGFEVVTKQQVLLRKEQFINFKMRKWL